MPGITSNFSSASPSRIQDRAEKLLKEMDTDSDGKVSKQEFAAFGENMKANGPRRAQSGDAARAAHGGEPPSADDMFAKADSDGDGSLSIENLSAMMSEHETHAAARGGHGHGGPHGAGGPPPGGGADATSDSASSDASADPADADHDGVVSAAEKLVYQLSHPNVSDTSEA